MAEISRKLLNDLTDELNALSAEGQRMVMNVLENAEWSSVEELREIAIEAMEMVCGTMTDMAAARTAEFYDNVRVASVGAALGAEPLSGRVPEATAGAVRAGIQSVVETGAIEQFGRFLTSRVDYEVKRASGECIYRNGQRDPLKPKFARVPSGSETCPFCLMLASRGFVYHDAKKAGEGNHFHANCDCRIVPGFQGNTQVEGYDPDALYTQWKNYGKASVQSQNSSLSKYSRPTAKGSRDNAVKFSNRLDRYNIGDDTYKKNCQRCVVAAELRRRGYDVVAKPRILNAADNIASNWRNLFTGATWDKAKSKRGADKLISAMPTGARGTVYIVWKGKRPSSHVFNFENTPSGVIYYDCQAGLSDVSGYFKFKSSKYDLEIARTDHLDIDPKYIDGVIENRM